MPRRVPPVGSEQSVAVWTAARASPELATHVGRHGHGETCTGRQSCTPAWPPTAGKPAVGLRPGRTTRLIRAPRSHRCSGSGLGARGTPLHRYYPIHRPRYHPNPTVDRQLLSLAWRDWAAPSRQSRCQRDLSRHASLVVWARKECVVSFFFDLGPEKLRWLRRASAARVVARRRAGKPKSYCGVGPFRRIVS